MLRTKSWSPIQKEAQINLILNWFEELKRLVLTNN